MEVPVDQYFMVKGFNKSVINDSHVICALILVLLSSSFLFAASKIKIIHSATAANLRGVYEAENNLKMQDTDNNGKHDYGTLGTLIQFNLLFKQIDYKDITLLKDNEIYNIGYYYLIVYLPVEESGLREEYWCAFAWPIKYGEDAYLTFFINEQGKIFEIDEPKYSGTEFFPKPEDVYTGTSFISEINTKKWYSERMESQTRSGKRALYFQMFFWILLAIAIVLAEVIIRHRMKNVPQQQLKKSFKNYFSWNNIAAMFCFLLFWIIFIKIPQGGSYPADNSYFVPFLCITLMIAGVFFSVIGIEKGWNRRIIYIMINMAIACGVVSVFMGTCVCLPRFS